MGLTSRTRFAVEAALAAVTATLSLLSLVSHAWIEAAFRIDPDAGDGSLEWVIVGVLLVASVSFSALARAEWRRRALAAE